MNILGNYNKNKDNNVIWCFVGKYVFFIDIPSILNLLDPGNVTELFLTFFPFFL